MVPLTVLAVGLLLNQKGKRLQLANQQRMEGYREALRDYHWTVRQNRASLVQQAARELHLRRKYVLCYVKIISPTMHAILSKRQGVLAMTDVERVLADPVIGLGICRAVVVETENILGRLPKLWPSGFQDERLKPAVEALRNRPSHLPLDVGDSAFLWESAFAVVLKELATEAAGIHRRSLADKLNATPMIEAPAKPRPRL